MRTKVLAITVLLAVFPWGAQATEIPEPLKPAGMEAPSDAGATSSNDGPIKDLSADSQFKSGAEPLPASPSEPQGTLKNVEPVQPVPVVLPFQSGAEPLPAAPSEPQALEPKNSEPVKVIREQEGTKAAKLPPNVHSKEDNTPDVSDTAPEDDTEKAVEYNTVILQGLNKVTGHVSKLDGPLGTVMSFGTIEIIAKRCWKSPPEQSPETAVLMEIRELKPGEESQRIFYGWMFASSPGLSGLEHPVYDIGVLSCEARSDPEKKDVEAEPKEEPAKPKEEPAKPKKSKK